MVSCYKYSKHTREQLVIMGIKSEEVQDRPLTQERFVSESRDKPLNGLQKLINALHGEFEKDNVCVETVMKMMASYKSTPQEWRKYAKFDRYRYTRNLVDEGNGKFNLIVVCWGEGHGSAIHDHADAHCFMKVLKGELSEVRFDWPSNDEQTNLSESGLKEIRRTQINTGEVCYINDSLGLHRVENPSHADTAVSLHLYSPPFNSCQIFNQQTGQPSKVQVTFWSKYGERRNKAIQNDREPEDN